MSNPVPALNHVQFQESLIAFLNHAMPTCAHMDYRLVGTGAAMLHGVSLPVGDIDILVRERCTLDAFASAMSSFKCLVQPVWLDTSKQYYCSFEVNGVEVQISTVEAATEVDTQECCGRGPWEHFTLLNCGRYSVPTVSLELRLITELVRNRPDRFDPIIQFMQTHGCDDGFLSRGIAAAGVSKIMQDDLLSKLQTNQPNVTGS